MTRIGIRIAVLIAFAVSWTGSAHAAADHLKCYKTSVLTLSPFASKFRATVDLNPPTGLDLPPSFGLEPGCVVRGKARMVCIPVDKTVDDIIPYPPLDIGPTQTLSDIRVCYMMKCPVNPTEGVRILDQFTDAAYTRFRASMLCLPAKPVDPTPNCGSPDASAPMCDGYCGQPNESCQDVGGNCQCVDNGCAQRGTPPQCFGECPGGGKCVAVVGGNCICDYDPPSVACGSASAPLCDGSCPGPSDTCTDVGGTCACVSRACGEVEGPPNCSGTCGFGGACKDVNGTCQCCSNSNPCP